MTREFTRGKIVKPGTTRFATTFLFEFYKREGRVGTNVHFYKVDRA